METENQVSLARNIKIGLFHLASGMADILTTGVWNRIMISDLGFAATPVGLLISLRYFLAPLGVWSGRVSDQRSIMGFRRTFWIWLGRLLMVLSTFALGYATSQLAIGAENGMNIPIIVISMTLFSLGYSLSGSTYLALIYDVTPEKQRGRVVGLVWAFLLLGFTVGGIVYGILLPSRDQGETLSFSPEQLLNLFIISGIIFIILWVISIIGEERRKHFNDVGSAQASRSSFSDDLRSVIQNRQLRYFMIYLCLSMMFAFSQDLVLEPFAAEVFDMPAETTNRFAAYWGSMSIIGTLVFIYLSYKRPWLTNTRMSLLGVGFLIATFIVLVISSVGSVRWLVTPALILLGIGLGIWNVGTLGLMMNMTPVNRAGTFLGFWTMIVTIARGVGVASGGIFRDGFLQVTGDVTLTYGLVFGVGGIGLLLSFWALRQVDVGAFQQGQANKQELDVVFSGAMD